MISKTPNETISVSKQDIDILENQSAYPEW